ncbi:DinB family protein [Flavobacterium sp.]|uniref:DinB family protein n=1 Tax=Flavobacterium sp. TaxID=239 RepID=UPI0026042DF6|nr:DinB family protein [Flavobacterium sp.]
MQATFEINHSSRNVLLKFLENHTLEELNRIPEGFANNLIWNIGHIVVVQQMLVYKLSGLNMMVSDEMVEKYKRGSKPEDKVSHEEVDEIKELLFSTLEQAKEDFANDIFDEYMEFTTMSGFTIKNAKAAMEFNNYHEATHTGIMMQIKKFV